MTIQDQIGNTIVCQTEPQRLVSLVPSLTETLIDLGLADRVVGRTKFCIHPKDQVIGIPKFGGTKNPNIQGIIDIKPDLIIANKEENRPEDIAVLKKHCPVYVSDIKTNQDAIECIKHLQNLLACPNGDKVIEQLKNCQQLSIPRNIRCLYLIWKAPYMSVGHDTFIGSVMQQYGFENVCHHLNRYPELGIEAIQQLSAQVIFLSSEPYPFKSKDVEDFQKKCPYSRIVLVDGELFSWYGTRMIIAHDYLIQLHRKVQLLIFGADK